MPLVFVHGVANRQTDRYLIAAALRDVLFRRFLLARICKDPDTAAILNPYWGDHAASLRWTHPSLPTEDGEALGSTRAIDDLAMAAVADARVHGAAEASVLLATARRSLSDAVDLLFAALGTAGPANQDPDALAQLALRLVAYCLSREQAMPRASETERYPWLATVGDDAAFIARLCENAMAMSLTPSGTITFDPTVAQTESFGIADSGRRLLLEGVARLRRATVHRVSTPLVSAIRGTIAPGTSVFLGDVLTYLAERGTHQDPGPIVRIVCEAIDQAQRDRRDDDPLVVVAHSMGGNIVYDILTFYRPDLRVDLLITVGSQVGFFEELKLFKGSDRQIPDTARPKAPSPDVGRWINVFDRADPLSYRAGPVFETVTDYAYPTGAWWAHGSYFVQPRFHERLARRIAGAGTGDQR
jgi:hypothetical protein